MAETGKLLHNFHWMCALNTYGRSNRESVHRLAMAIDPRVTSKEHKVQRMSCKAQGVMYRKHGVHLYRSTINQWASTIWKMAAIGGTFMFVLDHALNAPKR